MEGARVASHSGDGSRPPKGALYAAAAALFISRLGAWKPALPTRSLPRGFVPPKLKIRFLKRFGFLVFFFFLEL